MCFSCVCFQIANGCAGACRLHGRVIRCAVGRFVLQSDAVFAWRIRSCDIVTPVLQCWFPPAKLPTLSVMVVTAVCCTNQTHHSNLLLLLQHRANLQLQWLLAAKPPPGPCTFAPLMRTPKSPIDCLHSSVFPYPLLQLRAPSHQLLPTL